MTANLKYAYDWINNQPGTYTYYPATSDCYVATGNATTTPIRVAPVPSHEPWRALREWLRGLGARLASERGGVALPMMAGGAPDAETERRTEHKKKITIERKVGVPRDKGSGIQEIHKGSVSLVRTIEGDVVQTSTIGIKVETNGSGSYVEIPVDDLLAAVQELADEDVKP